jgi:mRNA interferase MazF
VNPTRGDVVLAWYPFSAGKTRKLRPCVVIQNDQDNQRLGNTIIVQITTNLRARNEPTHLFIDIADADGQQTGLLHDSLVSCVNIATIEVSLIPRVIGRMTPHLLNQLDQCLKLALGL